MCDKNQKKPPYPFKKFVPRIDHIYSTLSAITNFSNKLDNEGR